MNDKATVPSPLVPTYDRDSEEYRFLVGDGYGDANLSAAFRTAKIPEEFAPETPIPITIEGFDVEEEIPQTISGIRPAAKFELNDEIECDGQKGIIISEPIWTSGLNEPCYRVSIQGASQSIGLYDEKYLQKQKKTEDVVQEITAEIKGLDVEGYVKEAFAQVQEPEVVKFDADGFRNCEFCGCHTNARLRQCCSDGYKKDSAKPHYKIGTATATVDAASLDQLLGELRDFLEVEGGKPLTISTQKALRFWMQKIEKSRNDQYQKPALNITEEKPERTRIDAKPSITEGMLPSLMITAGMYSQFVSLFYSLMKDEIHPGRMEDHVQDTEKGAGQDWVLSNRHLARYCVELVERLRHPNM